MTGAYEGVVALRQDDCLLQAAHHHPPQLLQDALQDRFLTHGSEQSQPAYTHTHTLH